MRPASRALRNVLWILLAAHPLAGPAQSIGIGLKGGVRVSPDLPSPSEFQSESKRYTAGPMITVGLPLGFTLEADALYRRFAYSAAYAPILTSGIYARWTADSWEFPVVARRSIRSGLYAGAGYAPRTLHGGVSSNGIVFRGPDLSHLTPTYYAETVRQEFSTTHGLVVAAGLEKTLGRVRIAPEVRYTCWNRPAFDHLGGGDYNPVLTSSQHQVDFLLGISLHRPRAR